MMMSQKTTQKASFCLMIALLGSTVAISQAKTNDALVQATNTKTPSTTATTAKIPTTPPKKTAVTKSASAKTTKTAAKPDGIEVSPTQQSSMQEVAAIQVLSEICPQIIGKNKNFDTGYHLLLSDFLPGFKDPELALQALNENDDYQTVLKQARDDAAHATRENNREVCLGVIEWNKYANKK